MYLELIKLKAKNLSGEEIKVALWLLKMGKHKSILLSYLLLFVLTYREDQGSSILDSGAE